MFNYTNEEVAHLRDLIEDIFVETHVVPEQNDAAYWRHCAAAAREASYWFAAAESDEMADAIECGMHRGEELP